MVTDPINDMLTRIRNAQLVRKRSVVLPSSKMKLRICEILKEEGYISGFEVVANGGPQPDLKLMLKYFQGRPVVEEIKGYSKPGCRRYVGKKEIPWVYQGMGIAILSTSRGILSSRQAKQLGVGGELLCTVF